MIKFYYELAEDNSIKRCTSCEKIAKKNGYFSQTRFLTQEPVYDENGKLFPAQSVPEKSEAKLAEEIRAKRNALLKESDWTQVQDSDLSLDKKNNWLTYRQALRDISLQSTFPQTVMWPKI